MQDISPLKDHGLFSSSPIVYDVMCTNSDGKITITHTQGNHNNIRVAPGPNIVQNINKIQEREHKDNVKKEPLDNIPTTWNIKIKISNSDSNPTIINNTQENYKTTKKIDLKKTE